MKTVDQRIENLSDELLDMFIGNVARIRCGSSDKLDCKDCPLQIDGCCLCVKLYNEKNNRMKKSTINEETLPPPATTNELQAKAQELVKQLDHLVELLSKF